jgi:hypothetical protein
MPRRSPKRRKKSAPKKRKKKSTKKSRSAAAMKGWVKRRKKARLLTAMRAKGWRETALPTKDELVDYLSWLSDEYEIELSDMYRLYFGYDVGEAAE